MISGQAPATRWRKRSNLRRAVVRSTPFEAQRGRGNCIQREGAERVQALRDGGRPSIRPQRSGAVSSYPARPPSGTRTARHGMGRYPLASNPGGQQAPQAWYWPSRGEKPPARDDSGLANRRHTHRRLPRPTWRQLQYLYGFNNGWCHNVQLEVVLPREPKSSTHAAPTAPAAAHLKTTALHSHILIHARSRMSERPDAILFIQAQLDVSIHARSRMSERLTAPRYRWG